MTVSGSGYCFKPFHAVARPAAERTAVVILLPPSCSEEAAALSRRFYRPFIPAHLRIPHFPWLKPRCVRPAYVVPQNPWSARRTFSIMSHDIQLNPTASNPPAPSLPSPLPAEQSPRRHLPQRITAVQREDSDVTTPDLRNPV